MITPQYAQQMARYNAWQNNGIIDVVQGMDAVELDRDRGAFFGSIRRTLNHLLWGDQLWMARFDGGDGPDNSIADSVGFSPDIQHWCAARTEMDSCIHDWAQAVTPDDLDGDLTWFSGSVNHDMTRPIATCVTHFFNHQTHHRGQVHAMLTAAGVRPGATDLVFIPQD